MTRVVKILIVEDERPISNLMMLSLKRAGYACNCVYDGAAAADALEAQTFDLILLDVMLPEIDGFTLMEYIRPLGTPVIFITAKNSLDDRVRGLRMGAEDYIVKPFRPRELLSRIRGVLRRSGGRDAAVRIRNLTVDTEKGTVEKDGKEISLSALEYRLLLVFLNNRGRLLSRNRLLEEIWDAAGDFVNDNTLTVYIKRIREKIEDDPQNPAIIKTVRGLGYRVD